MQTSEKVEEIEELLEQLKKTICVTCPSCNADYQITTRLLPIMFNKLGGKFSCMYCKDIKLMHPEKQ